MQHLAVIRVYHCGQRIEIGAEATVGPFLVLPGQAAIIGHVGVKDCRKLALQLAGRGGHHEILYTVEKLTTLRSNRGLMALSISSLP